MTHLAASYSLNPRAVAQARRLIDAHQYVLERRLGRRSSRVPTTRTRSWSRTPGATTPHGISEFTDGASDDTKARYAFAYGDLRRVHRMGLIACQYRAAEWGHKEIELAAHELLQHLDKTRA